MALEDGIRGGKPAGGVGVAMCPPAVRMVCLVAWAWWGEDDEGEDWRADVDVLPVVALRSVTRHDDAEGCLVTQTDALILDDETNGVLSTPAEVYDDTHAMWRVFTTPWPPEEDARRFRVRFEAMKQDVIARAKRRREKREEKSGGDQQP